MRSIRVVFSVYRGKSGFHKTGKGFIDEENTLHLLMGFDVVKQEEIEGKKRNNYGGEVQT